MAISWIARTPGVGWDLIKDLHREYLKKSKKYSSDRPTGIGIWPTLG